MSKKANPKMIGAFVVGAVALVTVGLLIFGGGQFLAETTKYVLFFEGSVAGLNIGAPVNFRGVRIGQVTDIVMLYDPEKNTVKIPVYIETQRGRIQTADGQPTETRDTEELIELGLRGQLKMQSFVTGQMAIEFDFLPDSEVRLTGTDVGVAELPTVPSSFEELEAGVTSLVEKLGQLPLNELVVEFTKVAGTLNLAAEDVRGLVGNVDSKVDPLADSVIATSDQANATLADAQARLQMEPGEALYALRVTLDDARSAINRLDRQIDPLSEGAKSTFKAATSALEKAEDTIRDADRLIGPESSASFELQKTVKEIGAAAASIRRLAEYLERNPNALLTGKTGARN